MLANSTSQLLTLRPTSLGARLSNSLSDNTGLAAASLAWSAATASIFRDSASAASDVAAASDSFSSFWN